MSFVRGADNVTFLKKRFAALTANHCYRGMEFSDDKKQIAEWAPLIMEGRAADEAGGRDADAHGARMSITAR